MTADTTHICKPYLYTHKDYVFDSILNRGPLQYFMSDICSRIDGFICYIEDYASTFIADIKYGHCIFLTVDSFIAIPYQGECLGTV